MNDKIIDILEKYCLPNAISGTCGIQNLEKNKLSFINRAKYICFIKPNVGAYILIPKELKQIILGIKGNSYIIVDSPFEIFKKVHNAIYKNLCLFNIADSLPKKGKSCLIDKTVRFGKNVTLGDNVRIYPYVAIGSDVKIGSNTTIYPSTSIYDKVEIGNNCIIDSGVVIGGEGFRWEKERPTERFVHIGGVKIKNGVEIGSNSVIDRGSFENTTIGNKVKIDNLVHIGHNVTIKDNSRLCVGTIVGGRTIIEQNVWTSIGTSISDNIKIGENSQLLLNSVVASKVESDKVMGGFYAIDNKAWSHKFKDDYDKYVLRKRID